MARKLKQQDLKQSSTDSYTTTDGSLTKNDLQLTGDTNSVTAETIPFERTSATPTIKDVIDTLSAGGGAGARVGQFFTGDGTTTIFNLIYEINSAVPPRITLNGQELYVGASKDYTWLTNVVTFNWAPETGTTIYVEYARV